MQCFPDRMIHRICFKCKTNERKSDVTTASITGFRVHYQHNIIHSIRTIRMCVWWHRLCFARPTSLITGSFIHSFDSMARDDSRILPTGILICNIFCLLAFIDTLSLRHWPLSTPGFSGTRAFVCRELQFLYREISVLHKCDKFIVEWVRLRCEITYERWCHQPHLMTRRSVNNIHSRLKCLGSGNSD